MKYFLAIILSVGIKLHALCAQTPSNGMDDFMHQTGKINAVVAVIAAIFIGFAFYLIRFDRKLTKIEHQIFDKEK